MAVETTENRTCRIGCSVNPNPSPAPGHFDPLSRGRFPAAATCRRVRRIRQYESHKRIYSLWPAILAALWSSLLLNYFMTEPTGTLTMSDPRTVIALIVFTTVSAGVAVVVDIPAKRSQEVTRARA